MSYDNGDSNGDINTPADIELSWGRTVNDRKHTFVSSFVYGLPFQKEGVLGWVANGWQISGLFTAQSGTALDITRERRDCCARRATRSVPNMTGDAEILGDVGNGQLWFDTSVFSGAGGGHVRQPDRATAPASTNRATSTSMPRWSRSSSSFSQQTSSSEQSSTPAAGQSPGATVTITEQGTNIPASTVTNESGVYNFPNIKDGIYRVEAELTGFKKVLRENVRVDVNTTVRVDLELQTGEISEVGHGHRPRRRRCRPTAPTPAASSKARRLPRCRSASAATSRA